MKLSKNIIKAMAIEDMYYWINNFEKDGSIEKYDEETQETYWNYINKIKERIFKEL
jgi:hypothetical protein